MIMEIWAISKLWETLETFKDFQDADLWWNTDNGKEKFQILYRENSGDGVIRIYRHDQ